MILKYLISRIYADVAELADAHDSKSCGKPCGFESHHRYQREKKKIFISFFIFCIEYNNKIKYKKVNEETVGNMSIEK